MQISLAPVVRLLAGSVLLAGFALAQQTPAATTPTQSSPAKPRTSTARKTSPSTSGPLLRTEKEKASYALGMNIGYGLHHQGVPVDPILVSRGLRDAMAGHKTLLTEDEMKAQLTKLSAQVHEIQQARAHEAAAENRKAGEAFLAANKAKDGVVALPSGLQYKILAQGSGPKPTASDTVTCNYRGTLISGEEFDSSYKRGEPASFAVGGVIKGWTEALQMMPVGSKWQLFIPADLAYGDEGRPGIAPGDTLVFEVELLSIGEPKK